MGMQKRYLKIPTEYLEPKQKPRSVIICKIESMTVPYPVMLSDRKIVKQALKIL